MKVVIALDQIGAKLFQRQITTNRNAGVLKKKIKILYYGNTEQGVC